MTIDNNVGRVSNLGNVQEPQGKNQGVDEKTQAEPPQKLTPGQKFGKQMGRDMGTMGYLLTGHFSGVKSLVDSHDRGQKLLETKPERLQHLKERLPQIDVLVPEKKSEIATAVGNLLEKAGLGDREKKGVFELVEKLMEFKHDGKTAQPRSNTFDRLLNDHEDLAKEVLAKVDEYRSLKTEKQNGLDEQRMLNKLTPGKLVGKMVRAGLLALASPFITVLSTTMMAPLLPLWTGVALFRSAVYAAGGPVLGNENQGNRDKLKDSVK